MMAGLDLWTTAHFAWGLIFGLIGVRLATATALAFWWEWTERALGEGLGVAIAGSGLGDPSVWNGGIDVVAFIVAWALVRSRAPAWLQERAQRVAQRVGW